MKVYFAAVDHLDYLVATETRAEAARVMGLSRYRFDKVAQSTGGDNEAVALARPGVLFTRLNISHSQPWEAQG
jgi:hypothetical protein